MKHESLSAERLAGRFHKVMAWGAVGIGVLSAVYTVAMFAQAKWHFVGAKEHGVSEAELRAMEDRVKAVSQAVQREHFPIQGNDVDEFGNDFINLDLCPKA